MGRSCDACGFQGLDRVHWLIILVLAVVLYRQDRRLKALETRVAELLRRPEPVVRAAPVVPASVEPMPPAVSPWTAPEVAVEPLPVVAVPEPAPEPDPRPAAPPQPVPIPEPVMAEVAPPPAPLFQSAPSPATRPAAPAKSFSWPAVSTWLAENGLAWIGGGGLALGGLLLVMYAAQRGVFTPPLRIAAAVLLGGAMVAASEWILRQKQVAGGRHLLAAALAAGAGAVTLYGAVCAAHGLYHLIPLPMAAVLTGAISFGLLGLALRHGEPLALLAIFGAALAPLVTGSSDWAPSVLEAYLVLIGATGSALSAARHWGKAGRLTLAVLTFWSLGLITDQRTLDAAFLLLVAALGPFSATVWQQARGLATPTDRVFDNQPAVALGLVSLVSLGVWLQAPATGHDLPVAIILAAALVVLGAAGTVAGLIPAFVFAAPVAVAILASLMVLGLKGDEPETPWVFALAALIPASGLLAALRLREVLPRTLVLAISGIGAALLASLAWPLLQQAELEPAWLPAALISAGMFASAVLLVRRVEATGGSAQTDPGLGLWLGAAAELAFVALHAASPVAVEPATQALAALILALAAAGLGWRGLAPAAVAGGLMALAVMLRTGFIGEALAGRLALSNLLGISALTSALLFVGSRALKRRGEAQRNEREALSTAALLVLLLGLFTGLHIVLAGKASASGPLFEASLRTLLMLSAGLLLVARQRDDDGIIARGRAVAVIGVGILHGLIGPGLVLNPWWGIGEAPAGLPVFNSLILAFLAPALLLAATVRRRARPDEAWSRSWLVAAVVFGLLWILLVLRHLFHGAQMAGAPVERAEACVYAVLALLTAWALGADRVGTGRAQAAWLRAAAPGAGGISLAGGVLVFGLLASPWWGLSQTALPSVGNALLVFGLHALAVLLALRLRRGDTPLDRAALTVAAGLAVALLLQLLRWAFHGLDLTQGGIGRAEACAYAILGLLTARGLLSSRLAASHRGGRWLHQAAPAAGWIALAGAALVFGRYASPWWGPLDQPLASVPAGLLLFGLYGLGAATVLGLRRDESPFGRAALAVCVGILFALVSLLIRWAFHGADMSAPGRGGALETWTFSALWAVFGLAVLSLGSARRDTTLRWAGLAVLLLTAIKVMLFDLARLEGVIRAASFLAVGALFLVGALAARRLNAGSGGRKPDLSGGSAPEA